MNTRQKVTYFLTVFFIVLTVVIVCFMGFYAKRKLDAFEDANPEIQEKKQEGPVNHGETIIGPKLPSRAIDSNFDAMKRNLEQIDEVEDESASKYEQQSSVRTIRLPGISEIKPPDNHIKKNAIPQKLNTEEPPVSCDKHIQTQSLGILPEILETEERGIIETEPEEMNPYHLQPKSKANKTSLSQSKKQSPGSSEGFGLMSTALGTKNSGDTRQNLENSDPQPSKITAPIQSEKDFGDKKSEIQTKEKEIREVGVLPNQAIQQVTIGDTEKKPHLPLSLGLDVSVEEFVNDEESNDYKTNPKHNEAQASDKDSWSEIKDDEAARNAFEYLSRVRTLGQIYDMNVDQRKKQETSS